MTESTLGLLLFLCTAFVVTRAQWDYCGLDRYTQPGFNCFVENYGEPCSGIYCYNNNTYISIFVQKCEDPVSVLVHYDYYDYDFGFEEFQYVYNQSETVENDGYYSYYSYYYGYDSSGQFVEPGSYTGILDRNASHLGFELFVERDSAGAPEWIIYPVYIPLDPDDCLCSSMQNIAEDIHLLSDFTCNTTIGNCAEVVCDVANTPLQNLSMEVMSCTEPPSLEFTIILENEQYQTTASDTTTQELSSVGATLYIVIWQFDYSMDVQLSLVSPLISQEILSRHKIILDLTECTPPNPIDITTDSTIPPTIFTEPTVIPTTDISPNSTYDTCKALKSVTILDGTLCSTNEECNALECEIVNQRFEMAVDSCHDPPGIIVAMYDSTNNKIFTQSFYEGSTIVSDPRLPVDLNVTVEQLPNAISVEILGQLPPPLSYRLVLVPKTVIPIDPDSCTTLVPPTGAPSSTCSAMQYIQRALSAVSVESCYFPLEHNCTILTCPVNQGLDLTIEILRCAHPPAVRVIYGNAFIVLFDHTFDHSEVVPIPFDGFGNDTALNVTLDQLCPSDIGLQVDLLYDSGSTTVIPYTVIPINTTGCGPDSGKVCPTSTPTTKPTDATPTTEPTDATPTTEPTDATPTTEPTDATPTTEPTDATPTTEPTDATPTDHHITSHTPSTTPSVVPPTKPAFSKETCIALTDIAEQLVSVGDDLECSVSDNCDEIQCKIYKASFNITLKCSPIGINFSLGNGTQPIQSKFFTKSGIFLDDYQVTVINIDNKALDFALAYHIKDGLDKPIVNKTRIPMDGCADSAQPTSSQEDSNNDHTLPVAVGTSVGLILIVIVIIIVVITGVYLVRRRRYRHYQLHRMTMSELDDEDC